MFWMDEMLQEGKIKSHDVVFHHDGQCHNFHVIYDDYETRDERHGVGDVSEDEDDDDDIMMKCLSVCYKI